VLGFHFWAFKVSQWRIKVLIIGHLLGCPRDQNPELDADKFRQNIPRLRFINPCVLFFPVVRAAQGFKIFFVLFGFVVHLVHTEVNRSEKLSVI
jgi:hypothetical protein